MTFIDPEAACVKPFSYITSCNLTSCALLIIPASPMRLPTLRKLKGLARGAFAAQLTSRPRLSDFTDSTFNYDVRQLVKCFPC